MLAVAVNAVVKAYLKKSRCQIQTLPDWPGVEAVIFALLEVNTTLSILEKMGYTPGWTSVHPSAYLMI